MRYEKIFQRAEQFNIDCARHIDKLAGGGYSLFEGKYLLKRYKCVMGRKAKSVEIHFIIGGGGSLSDRPALSALIFVVFSSCSLPWNLKKIYASYPYMPEDFWSVDDLHHLLNFLEATTGFLGETGKPIGLLRQAM